MRCAPHCPDALVSVGLAFVLTALSFAADYEVGGPLAGEKLPTYPVYHGERPGHPGNSFGPPQLLLYPGSVENWRGYWFKYAPQRSFFDRQSQIKLWTAPDIPGAPAGRRESYAQPIWNVPRFAPPKPTGQFEPPVDVLRVRPGEPIFSADLGELERGIYCLRLIGCATPDQATEMYRNFFLIFRVNDTVGGGESVYRVRTGYCDQFYSIGELYFHAVEKRRFKVALTLDPATEVELLVRNISLDDALAGIERRPFKTRSNDPLPEAHIAWYKSAQEARLADPALRAARLERDALIWSAYPRVNCRWDFNYHDAKTGVQSRARPGVAGKPAAEIEQEFGKWEHKWSTPNAELPILLRNAKLNLTYTVDDLNSGRPLPDPFPYKDDGNGVKSLDADSTTHGWFWGPVARAVLGRRIDYQHRAMGLAGILARDPKNWKNSPEEAHDALVAFARFVYDLPTLDPIQDVGCILSENGPYGRSNLTRRRETVGWFYTWYTQYPDLCELYEKHFDLIKDNQELADSLRRFVPWLRTPQDVIEMFDAYLLQHTAKRILRYHYYVGPVDITRVATVLGDAAATRPWMQWQFSRAFVYPLPLTGVQYLLVSGHDRSGIEYGTSSFYGGGENAARMVTGIEKYVAATGAQEFSLADAERYPKAVQSLWWPIRMSYAGYEFPRIGDVSGPDKIGTAMVITNGRELLTEGWRRERTPVFAAVMKHVYGKKNVADAEWAEIERAAAGVTRLPWFENKSRFVPNWAGILEQGTQHDDFRFRRGLMVRTGRGIGHQHNDTLDLQLTAHGTLMLVDAGQRPGYSKPACAHSTVHNLVTALDKDGKPRDAYFYSWVRNLVDGPEAAYLHAHAGEPGSLNHGARQVALIAVDEGTGSEPLPIEKQGPGVKLSENVVTANSYAFDVFCMTGGVAHRYNFHAMVNDQFEWNAANVRQDPQAFGGMFSAKPDLSFTGEAVDGLTATWRMRREPAPPENRVGTEKQALGVNYNPDSAPRYLRLHMPAIGASRLHRGELVTTLPQNCEHHFTCIGVDRPSPSAQAGTCFAAIIEPYVGQPILRKVEKLTIGENFDDAQCAVAMQVETVNGHRDFLFADAQTEKVRTVAGARARVSGEFAFQSVDERGLRVASLAGGTLLETPDVRIRLPRREITGRVVSVDFPKKQFVVDAAWPKQTPGFLVEIGHERKMTAFTIVAVEPLSTGHTRLTTQDAADHLWANITSVDEEKRLIFTAVGLTPSPGPGEQKGWYATNENRTKSWRADVAGGGFRLGGDHPLSAADFAPSNEFRLWEFGPGDTVRQATFVSVRRAEPGYAVTSVGEAVVEVRGAGGWKRLRD